MKTISISLYRRADYTKQVLDALLECSGIEDYFVLIQAEPAKTKDAKLNKEIEDTIKITENFKHSNKKIIINETVLGCSKNIYSCIDYCFKNTDTSFHVHLEDDTVPSKDYLLFCEWSSEKFKNDKRVATVCGFTRKNIKNDFDYKEENLKELQKKVTTRDWFHPWGWGIWRDRWEKNLSKQLWTKITSKGGYLSWDILSRKILVDDQKLSEVFPVISRIQNIGALKGVHCPGVDFHTKHQKTEIFASDLNVFSDKFEFVP
jgi:hypothetical protein